MIRLVADFIGHIPLSWIPPCYGKQVGRERQLLVLMSWKIWRRMDRPSRRIDSLSVFPF